MIAADRTNGRPWASHPMLIAVVFYSVCFTILSLLNDTAHALLGWDVHTSAHRYTLALVASVMWAVSMRLLRARA